MHYLSTASPRLFTPVAAVLLAMALALPMRSPVLAAGATLSVSPKVVKVGHMVTVTASSVHPGTTLFLLLVPDYQKPHWQKLMGYVRSNSSGRVGPVRVLVPSIKFCGKASVLLFSPKQKSVSARVTVSGCKGGAKPTGTATIPAPPPPPKKGGH